MTAPLVVLDERLARALATPHTPGAFRIGVRLMAIEGSVELVRSANTSVLDAIADRGPLP
jgi:hypothetical protein